MFWGPPRNFAGSHLGGAGVDGGGGGGFPGLGSGWFGQLGCLIFCISSGTISGEASTFTILSSRRPDLGIAVNTFDAALDVVVPGTEIPFVMSSGTRVFSLVVAFSS
jgi:hypothetical protein